MQDNTNNSVSAPEVASVSLGDAMSSGVGEHSHHNSAALTNGNGAAPERPRSGYARIRQRHHRLIEQHEQLKADFAALSEMYRQMEAALYENTELLEQVQSRQPSQPPQYRPEPTIGLQSLFARGVR